MNKEITRRLMTVLLSMTMVLCMMPTFAWAEMKIDCQGGEGCTHAAAIDNTHYDTLADAIAAVPTDGTETTITMIADEAVKSSAKISAQQKVVLELNGKVVSCDNEVKTAFPVIENSGTLTIQDITDTYTNGSGSGKITSEAYNPDMSLVPGYATNTITNYGKLTVQSGWINSGSMGSASFAIDNEAQNAQWHTTVDASKVELTVNGGKITSGQSDSIRQYLRNGGQTDNVISITGGVIGSLWVQDSSDAKGSLTIKNATFTNDVCVGYEDVTENFVLDIQDSTFGGLVQYELDAAKEKNTIVYKNNVAAPFYMTQPSKILDDTTGKFIIKKSVNIGWVWVDTGTESNYPTAEGLGIYPDTKYEGDDTGNWYQGYVTVEGQLKRFDSYIKDGYELVKIDEPDTYIVRAKQIARIGNTIYPSLEAAYTAANDGDHIEILVDTIELTDVPSAKKNITVSGLTDESGKPATTVTEWTANTGSRNNGCTFENFIVTAQVYGFAGNNTTIKNCKFTGNNGFITAYAYGLLTIDNCDFDTTTYGIHFDGGSGNVVVKNSKISGFNTFAKSLESLTFDNCEFLGRNKAYSVVQTWGKMIIKNSTFDDAFFNNTCYVGTTQAGCSVIMENVKMAEGSSKTLGDELIGAKDASYTAMDVSRDATGKFTAGKLIGGNDAETFLPTLLADGYIIVAGENGWYIVKHVEVIVEPVVVDDEGNITVGGEEITVKGTGEQGQPTVQQAAEAITETLNNPEVVGFTDTKIEEATPVTEETTIQNVDDTGFNLSMILDAVKEKAAEQFKEQNGEAKASANGEITVKTTNEGDGDKFVETDVTKQITVDLTAAAVETVVATGATTTVTSMTFEVKPVANITVTSSEGEAVTVTAIIPNEAITAPITFRLPVDSSVTETWAAVYHEGEFMGNYEIKGNAENGKYIEVSSMKFSEFSYVLVNSESAGAKIGEVPYQTFAEAVAAVKDNETIIILKDNTDTTRISVSRTVTFTVDNNGKTNRATIVAGDGYVLSRDGNTYTVKEYVPAPVTPVTPETEDDDIVVPVPVKTPVLLVKGATSGSKAVKLSWNKVEGASKYYVYGNRCGKTYKLIATVNGKNSYTVKKISGKKLAAHKTYKFYVVAKTADGKLKSKAIHFITANTNGKYANVKSIKAKASTLQLAVGEMGKVGATYKMYSGKKHISSSHGKALRYISDCPEVVSVSSSGKLLAKKAGTATIYIQDIGGKYCKTVVTVK